MNDLQDSANGGRSTLVIAPDRLAGRGARSAEKMVPADDWLRFPGDSQS
jgi:hypothetical protein